MNDVLITRKRFRFEREFGQHRNWWVRDPRIAGNPLSLYLFLLSHDPERMPTQTETMRQLGLGKDAWQSAKAKLLKAGFLLEVRDRYPAGAVNRQGKPCGGQRRFRLELLDPEPGMEYALEDVVLELDAPLEEYEKTPGQSQCGKSALGEVNHCGKSAVDAKPLVRASAENPQWDEATAENPQSFIGKEERLGLGMVRLGSLEDQPTRPDQTDAGARENDGGSGIPVAGVSDELAGEGAVRTESVSGQGSVSEVADADEQAVWEAAVDVELARLVDISPPLTVASIRHELAGRVPVAELDVVQAVRDTLLRASESVARPAAYVASVIARNPEKWRKGALPVAPGTFRVLSESERRQSEAERRQAEREARRRAEREDRAACQRGEHDWGPVFWPEHDRSRCLREWCLKSRYELDPEYAELVDAEFERIR